VKGGERRCTYYLGEAVGERMSAREQAHVQMGYRRVKQNVEGTSWDDAWKSLESVGVPLHVEFGLGR